MTMEVDTELLPRLLPLTSIDNELVLSCCRIDHYYKRNQIEKAYFLATEFELYLFARIGRDKIISEIFRAPWDQITKIIYTSQTTFQFNHKNGTLTLETDNCGPFLMKLASHFYNLFGDPCFIEGAPKNFILSQKNQLAPLIRLKYNMFIKGKKPSQALLAEFQNIILSGSKVYDLNRLPGAAHHLPSILASIMKESDIEEIILPPSPQGGGWVAAAEYIEKNKTLKRITFSDKTDPTFRKIVEAFRNNRESQITHIGFVNTGFGSESVSVISDILRIRPLVELSFGACISGSDAINLFKAIGRTDYVSSLKCLKFDKIKGIDPVELIRLVPMVTSLTFDDCATDLSSLFPELSSTKLESIYVSGGYAEHQIAVRDPLPQSLINFRFSNCEWKGFSFIEAWCILLQHRPEASPIHVDLSNAITSDVSFQHLFSSYCSVPSTSFGSLVWDGNPTPKSFVKFILDSPRLFKISLVGCFTNVFRESIMLLADSLQTNGTIRELDISGSDMKSADSALLPIFQSLPTNRSLKVLKVNKNNLGSAGLATLAQSITRNSSLEKIEIASNIGLDSSVLIHFMETIQTRDLPIEITSLEADIEELCQNASISTSDCNKLRSLRDSARKSAQKSSGKTNEFSYTMVDFPRGPVTTVNPVLSYSEITDGKQWTIPFPEIQPTDNSQITGNLPQIYSIETLIQQIQST